MLVRNLSASEMEMLLQASMNTLKKWFTEIVEILKTVSYELAYQ